MRWWLEAEAKVQLNITFQDRRNSSGGKLLCYSAGLLCYNLEKTDVSLVKSIPEQAIESSCLLQTFQPVSTQPIE